MSSITIAIPKGTSVTYGFQIGGLVHPDPHNRDGAGPQHSLLHGSNTDRTFWPPRSSSTIANLPGTRLSLDRELFGRRCTARFNERGAQTTAVFLDGDDWIHLHDLNFALDQAVSAKQIPEVNRLFLPAAKDRSEEYTSSACAQALAAELPHLISSKQIILVGQSLSGLAALRAGVIAGKEKLPAIYGVIAQSPAVWWSINQQKDGDALGGPAGGVVVAELAKGLTTSEPSQLPRIILTAGTEEQPMHRHIDATANALIRSGFPTMHHRTLGGHDPAMWRYGVIPALRELLR
ncbi:alpha/beta hydrolase-fold protein [Corynebacterium sp. zg254]|nr:alpha/beta hydrolase-fold protein [Corynebacterium sp. zg254]